MSNYKIIDFHTHPFLTNETNICKYISSANTSVENTKKDLQKLGVEAICGSVIKALGGPVGEIFEVSWQQVKALNDEALKLKEIYGDFYCPGFHIHPAHKKESILEIERMNKLGVKIIGELVAYMQGWNDYGSKEMTEILECAEHYDMIVSFHGAGGDFRLDGMDKMVKRFKNLKIVGAHPNSGDILQRHLNRFEYSDNYFVDVSGGGLSSHGTVRYLIDKVGKEKILFGSDYPTCNIGMFIGGITNDFLLSEDEKEHILYKNAKKLLQI